MLSENMTRFDGWSKISGKTFFYRQTKKKFKKINQYIPCYVNTHNNAFGL